jgi:hypothetical protein
VPSRKAASRFVRAGVAIFGISAMSGTPQRVITMRSLTVLIAIVCVACSVIDAHLLATEQSRRLCGSCFGRGVDRRALHLSLDHMTDHGLNAIKG